MQLMRRLPPEKFNCKLYFYNQLQLIRNGGSRKNQLQDGVRRTNAVNAPHATREN